jgi:hypothetical protein
VIGEQAHWNRKYLLFFCLGHALQEDKNKDDLSLKDFAFVVV